MIKPNPFLHPARRTAALAFVLGAAAALHAAPACAPPPGFADTPRPAVAPAGKLIAHTEEVTVNRPLRAVLEIEARTKLEDLIDRGGSLPGVSGTHMLTKGEFGPPGSRRLTCLTDGSSLVEEVMVNSVAGQTAEFQYVVWNYTTEKARPIEYGVGRFLRTELPGGRTHVRWTYAFQLNRRRFPGALGPLGDFLFRAGFLEREYAAMMRRTLAGSKERIEKAAWPPAP